MVNPPGTRRVPPALLRRVLDAPLLRPDAVKRGRTVAAQPGDRSHEVAASLVHSLVNRRLP